MKRTLFLSTILFSFVFTSDQYKTENSIIYLLEDVISKYEKNLSFSISLSNEDVVAKIRLDMAWIDDSTFYRKTRLNFIEGLEYSGLAWTWSKKHGKNKKWITKSNGKVVDVSKRKEFDFPVILPDRSILSAYHIASDTLNYNDSKCVIIESYKISRGKKKGPISKTWIDLEKKIIYKVEEFDYRKKIATKETTMEYFSMEDPLNGYLNSFPKVINISNFKTGDSSSMQIFDYEIAKRFDLEIFEPADIHE